MNTPLTPARPVRVKEPSVTEPGAVRRITEYVAGSVPELHRLATTRALLGQTSRTNAVKMKCLQCCGYQREEIKVCAVITCALHSVRPYARRDDSDSED